MDIKIAPRPWYIKYRMYIAGGTILTAIIIYTIVLALSPRRQRVDADRVKIAETAEAPFMEFLEVEGIVHPIMTIQLNATENGFVKQIVCEEGAMLRKGDTILVLDNPDLLRTIEQERADWEKAQRNLREQEIQMEQKSIDLKLLALEQEHQIGNLERQLTQIREEFSMGIKSRAQLSIAEADYKHQHRKLLLQMQSLKQDSASTLLRREMIVADRQAAERKLHNARRRTDGLVVTAPVDGQLGHLNLTIGQQVSAGSKIGELKIMSNYKVRTQLSEYYVERIHAGLPATVTQKQDTFPLRITRVVPEVKDRKFDADLLFNDVTPENIRLGKSYRVRIELGQPEEAVVIPRGDFYQKTSGRWIFRIDEGSNVARRVEVEIGRQNPEQFEVLKGLAPGDRVIVSGYDRLGDVEEVIID